MFFPEGSNVLFVGEGDFSFVTSLIKEVEKGCSKVKFVASCLQEELSERAQKNCGLLHRRGVQVVLGVDGTQLHKHPIIKHCSFTHIVFNFPHIGGKMRIDMNRHLLRDFFESAVGVLREGGQVIVTLCAGQGGIPIDPVTRRWDDTWKVVLMASYADLVLRKIRAFHPETYQGYSGVGYRSLEKGFCQQGALTYVFEVDPLSLNLSCIDPQATEILNSFQSKVPFCLYHQLKRNPILDKTTMLGCLFRSLVNYLSTILPVHVGETYICENYEQLISLMKGGVSSFSKLALNSIQFNPTYRINMESCFQVDPVLAIVSGSCESRDNMNRRFKDFTVQVMNSGKDLGVEIKYVAVDNFIEEKLQIEQRILDGNEAVNKTLVIHMVSFGNLTRNVFETEKEELWAAGHSVEILENTITYTPRSLFPLEYSYDLSFWEPQNDPKTSLLDQEVVQIIIVNSAGDILKSCVHLSTYCHPLKMRWSHTYRLKYRSFVGALSDKKAKEIHSSVGRKLECCLGVIVR